MVAVFGYFLPFFHYGVFAGVLGIQLIPLPFEALDQSPSAFWWLLAFGVFTLPAIAAVAGLVYHWRAGWNRPLIALLIAALGFVGLGVANFSSPRIPWDLGYYAVEAGFLIAAAGATMRWITGHRFERQVQLTSQPGRQHEN